MGQQGHDLSKQFILPSFPQRLRQSQQILIQTLLDKKSCYKITKIQHHGNHQKNQQDFSGRWLLHKQPGLCYTAGAISLASCLVVVGDWLFATYSRIDCMIVPFVVFLNQCIYPSIHPSMRPCIHFVCPSNCTSCISTHSSSSRVFVFGNYFLCRCKWRGSRRACRKWLINNFLGPKPWQSRPMYSQREKPQVHRPTNVNSPRCLATKWWHVSLSVCSHVDLSYYWRVCYPLCHQVTALSVSGIERRVETLREQSGTAFSVSPEKGKLPPLETTQFTVSFRPLQVVIFALPLVCNGWSVLLLCCRGDVSTILLTWCWTMFHALSLKTLISQWK